MSEANALGSSNSQILTRRRRAALADASTLAKVEARHRQDSNALVEFYPDGSLLKVCGLPGWSSEEDGEGTRKPCREFTWKARRAMLELLAKMRREARPVFVTLTFPREMNVTPEEAKECLRITLQRWTRADESISALWKMEPQADGTPHFHLFVWGVDFIPWQLVAVEWAETIANRYARRDGETWWKSPAPPIVRGKQGADLFRAWLEKIDAPEIFKKTASSATRVEAIRERNGVKFYAAKYLAKEVGQLTLWEEPGRFWGVYQRDKLPTSRCVPIEVTRRVGVRFARLLRRAARSWGGRRIRHVRRMETEAHVQWMRALCFLETGPAPHNFVTGEGSLS